MKVKKTKFSLKRTHAHTRAHTRTQRELTVEVAAARGAVHGAVAVDAQPEAVVGSQHLPVECRRQERMPVARYRHAGEAPAVAFVVGGAGGVVPQWIPAPREDLVEQ